MMAFLQSGFGEGSTLDVSMKPSMPSLVELMGKA
jgi:hypothetical protein